jgi:hypothetical protein
LITAPFHPHPLSPFKHAHTKVSLFSHLPSLLCNSPPFPIIILSPCRLGEGAFIVFVFSGLESWFGRPLGHGTMGASLSDSGFGLARLMPSGLID